jgi:hypothetical protein
MQLPDYTITKIPPCLRASVVKLMFGFLLHPITRSPDGPITRFLSLVLPDRLSLLQHCTQAFLHILQVHQFVEINIL